MKGESGEVQAAVHEMEGKINDAVMEFEKASGLVISRMGFVRPGKLDQGPTEPFILRLVKFDANKEGT